MTTVSYSVTADFDGTLFDPSVKAFIAWYYNSQTTQLVNAHHIPFILNTGRPIWDAFSDVQIAVAGMKKPDVVVFGAGTKIVWRRKGRYELDQKWEETMRKTGWEKERILQAIAPVLKEYNAALFDTKNEYMTRIWIRKIPIERLNRFIKSLNEVLKKTKILRTEQILLPNTEVVFSGYLLLIPDIAGKEAGMKHVLDILKPEVNLAFGDALVDLPMLMDASSEGFAVNPTALARKELKNTKVTILEGSPPENILRTLSSKLHTKTTTRNSPYRSISDPLVTLIEPFVYPKLTANQLSMKGLEIAQNALKKGQPINLFSLVAGYIIDLIDGARSRKRPEMATEDGQLVDVYADRMKESLELQLHGHFDASLTCFLPSIARAQAEAMGLKLDEFDSAGGSALSRSMKLIKSYFLYSIGRRDGSNRIDQSIQKSNMQTFHKRRSQAKSFSWNSLKNYDKKSVKRLLFLVSLLHKETKKQEVEDGELKEILKEYSKINVDKLTNELKITFPKLTQ